MSDPALFSAASAGLPSPPPGLSWLMSIILGFIGTIFTAVGTAMAVMSARAGKFGQAAFDSAVVEVCSPPLRSGGK